MWVFQKSLMHFPQLTYCCLPHISSCLCKEPHGLILPESCQFGWGCSESANLSLSWHPLGPWEVYVPNNERADSALALPLCVAAASLSYRVYFPQSLGQQSSVAPKSRDTYHAFWLVSLQAFLLGWREREAPNTLLVLGVGGESLSQMIHQKYSFS